MSAAMVQGNYYAQLWFKSCYDRPNANSKPESCKFLEIFASPLTAAYQGWYEHFDDLARVKHLWQVRKHLNWTRDHKKLAVNAPAKWSES